MAQWIQGACTWSAVCDVINKTKVAPRGDSTYDYGGHYHTLLITKAKTIQIDELIKSILPSFKNDLWITVILHGYV